MLVDVTRGLQRQPAMFLSNFESGLRILADHGIGVVAVLFNRWRDTVCRRHMN